MKLDLSIYGLHRFGPHDVVPEPFPHIFVPSDALPASVYQHLFDRYPPLDFFVGDRTLGENHKIHCATERILRGDGLDPCWVELADRVTRSTAFDELMRIFRPHVARSFPALAGRYDADDLVVGRRVDAAADMRIEQQVTVHTPVIGAPAAERGPHIKQCTKLFVCMAFLPCEPDLPEGGEFVVCRRRPHSNAPFGKAQALDLADVEEVAVLPYAPNSMVIFMNSPHSIVYARPRTAGPQPIRYVHFVVESPRALFDIPRVPGHEAPWRRLIRPAREAWWRLRRSHPGFTS